MGATSGDEDTVIPKLRATQSRLKSVLRSAAEAEWSLAGVDERLSRGLEVADAAAEAVAPLLSQSIDTKALHARINRAVSPALTVLQGFSLVESLQRRLLRLPSSSDGGCLRLARLLKYVGTVDRLHLAITSVTEGCVPAVQRLQEAVEFLSRIEATDRLRIKRLRETLAALKALYETEVDTMRYEGLLDEALLRLQDEFEFSLQQLRHRGIGDTDNSGDTPDDHRHQLGSGIEIEILNRIAHILATNDCLDICIDIYVKVRYRSAAKALMQRNSGYLKTYALAEIDGMEWEELETAISLWIEHLELTVRTMLVAEKRLCSGVLAGVMDGAVWPECFFKIAENIMDVFFRFGEGVARSTKEPQKLFKLLDMFDTMDRMCNEFVDIFDGEPGIDICDRFRELQKLLVRAASKVFWEFCLKIDGGKDGAAPPADGSVPAVVRYAVNYLKCLAADGYAAAMGRVLQTEQVWEGGFRSRPEALLRGAVSTVLDALQRNVDAKRQKYKDKVAASVFAMNAYWYMYMRTKGSELAALVGAETMRRRYKALAEEAAYTYQAQAWGPLVRLLKREEGEGMSPAMEREGAGEKMEAFLKGFEENLRRHRSNYCIPDTDLREQIKEAVARLVVKVYDGFLHIYAPVMQGRSLLPPDLIRGELRKLFNSNSSGGGGKSVDWSGEETRSSVEEEEERRRSVEGNSTGVGGEGGRTASGGGGGEGGGNRRRGSLTLVTTKIK